MELQPPRTGRSPADFAAVGLLVAAHDCRIDRKGQDARRSQRVSSARAQLCVHPAKGATTPEQRDHFAKLARTWIKLAEELEQSEAFLAAIEDDEPTKQTG